MIFISTLLLMSVFQLDLVQSYRVSTSPEERLDLSGLVKLSAEESKAFDLEGWGFLLVNDRSPKIYRAKIDGTQMRAEPWIDLAALVSLKVWDLEDISISGASIYVVNEPDGRVIEIKSKTEALLAESLERRSAFKLVDYFGAEAFESYDSQFYFGREMPPAVFKTRRGSGLFEELALNSKIDSVTSLRISQEKETKGRLYILDRNMRCVWIQDVGQEAECFSIRRFVDENPDLHYIVLDSEGKLRLDWSTAEALDVDGETLYIGLDNNALPLKKGPPDDLRPSILVLQLSTKAQ